MVTFLLGSLTVMHSSALLNLFISCDASICSTVGSPPLVNFDHIVASFPIDCTSNSKGNAPLHCTVYLFADWASLLDHLRDVHSRTSLKLVLRLTGLNCVSGSSSKLIYISFVLTIRSRLIQHHSFEQLVLLP